MNLRYLSSLLLILWVSQIALGQENESKPPLLKDVKIAFVSYRTGSAEIYMMNSDGSDVKQITSSEEDNSFPSQVDERTLGFLRYDSAQNAQELQVDIYNLQVSERRRRQVVEGAKWEAQGSNQRYVAYVRSNDYSDRELYLFDKKTRTEKKLTSKEDPNYAAYSINHSWSPDGKQLVFMSGYDWYNQFIWIYDLKSDEIRPVTDRGYMNSGLLWLKDNKNLIANLKIRDETMYEIYNVNVKTGKLEQLTTGINLHPNLSPDGEWVVFESQRHGNDGEVYIMRPDGSDQFRLTNNPDYNGRCIWFKL